MHTDVYVNPDLVLPDDPYSVEGGMHPADARFLALSGRHGEDIRPRVVSPGDGATNPWPYTRAVRYWRDGSGGLWHQAALLNPTVAEGDRVVVLHVNPRSDDFRSYEGRVAVVRAVAVTRSDISVRFDDGVTLRIDEWVRARPETFDPQNPEHGLALPPTTLDSLRVTQGRGHHLGERVVIPAEDVDSSVMLHGSRDLRTGTLIGIVRQETDSRRPFRVLLDMRHPGDSEVDRTAWVSRVTPIERTAEHDAAAAAAAATAVVAVDSEDRAAEDEAGQVAALSNQVALLTAEVSRLESLRATDQASISRLRTERTNTWQALRDAAEVGPITQEALREIARDLDCDDEVPAPDYEFRVSVTSIVSNSSELDDALATFIRSDGDIDITESVRVEHTVNVTFATDEPDEVDVEDLMSAADVTEWSTATVVSYSRL